jgi:hypothetical protein
MRTIPTNLYDELVSDFVENVAIRAIEFLGSDHRPSSTLVTPGDPFARLMTWLWRSFPDEAVSRVVEYVYAVRRAAPDPDLTTDAILLGVSSIRGHHLSTGEVDALIEQARRRL